MRALSASLLVVLLLAPAALAEDPEPTVPNPDWSTVESVPAKAAEQAEAATTDAAADRKAPAAEAAEAAEADAKDPPTGETPADEVAEPEPFVMPTVSTVVDIRKKHNADWIGNWKALELELVVAIVGQKSQRVGVSVVFYEAATGMPLHARMQPYVDGAGHVSVYSQAVPIPVDSGLYTSNLKIPYRAFPWPTKGPAYGVEARVRLLRLEKDGKVTQLADGSTHFTVQYEKGCGTSNECPCPFGRASRHARMARYDWHKLWGDCLGRNPSESGLPPPKGQGARKEWFEKKWRTRGGCIDEQGKPR